jgi:hypothetical protein
MSVHPGPAERDELGRGPGFIAPMTIGLLVPMLYAPEAARSVAGNW